MDDSIETPDDALATLLERVGSGDRAALRRFYDLQGPRLLGIARRMLGRRDLAEDTVQEAFVAIWVSAKSYDRTKGRARAWAATILRRKAIDRLRTSPWLDRVPLLDEPAADLPNDVVAISVKQCLERLDRTKRKALLLVYYYGLSHDELQRYMDSPLGTVKSWVRRGILELRECLAE